MKRFMFVMAAVGAGVMFLHSCAKFEDPGTALTQQLNLPAQPYQYDAPLPADFTGFQNFNNGGDIFVDDFITIPALNTANPQVTNHGATLGRVLFYDKKMSLNNATACGSCHKQALGFADGKNISAGFEGKKTTRNSMAIVNPVLNNSLFWDSRASSVPALVLQPVQNHVEMGMESLKMLEQKLAQTDYYPALFKNAFGTEEITAQRISTALSEFLCSMVSTNAKFDQGKTTDFANYNALEKAGKDLFFSERAKCSQCHAGPNFSAPDFEGGGYSAPDIRGTANIGLDLVYADNGKGEGQFKIPALRNIALTAPYMHDGRFNTLEQVVNHYSNGIKNHNNLDVKFRNGNGALALNFNEAEKRALVAFLNTLTDNTYITDVKYSDPFKK